MLPAPDKLLVEEIETVLYNRAARLARSWLVKYEDEVKAELQRIEQMQDDGEEIDVDAEVRKFLAGLLAGEGGS